MKKDKNIRLFSVNVKQKRTQTQNKQPIGGNRASRPRKTAACGFPQKGKNYRKSLSKTYLEASCSRHGKVPYVLTYINN